MRRVSATFREEIEKIHGSDVVVSLATIYHSTLETPIRVTTDIYDYWYDGNVYTGAAFSLGYMSDDDKPPRAQLSVLNVDRLIGNAVLQLYESPRLDFMVLLKSDFNDDDPRRPIVGTPSIEYRARFLFLKNVTCDAMQLRADITSYDLSTEPWPAIRSTPDNMPALYR